MARRLSGLRAKVVPFLRSWLGPFVGLLVVVLVFEAYHHFLQPDRPFLNTLRIAAIAKQSAIVGVGALGMTVIIISGGIDLSVGSMLALSSVVFALFLRERPPDWMVEYIPAVAAGWDATSVATALALVIATGVSIGALNGLLITRLGLVPFIVTLGTMLVFRGVAEWLADQKKVVVAYDSVPTWLARLLDPPKADSWLPLVCPAVWFAIFLAIVLALVLRFTVFGRYVFAIGSNEQAARLCGIPVKRMKIAFYALGGFFMAVAGVFGFSEQYAQGDPSSGIALELDIIAAVVIGGGSLSGGRGSVLGSLLGALTMTTLRSGCDYAGISVSMQKIVIGAIIVMAVAIDGWMHPRK
jgi:ribose/xylose/arabinose/galactoside ABC-type transport system permease subunit